MPGIMSPNMIMSPTSFNDHVYCTFFLEKQFAFGNWNSDLQDNRAWISDAFLDAEQWPISYLACRALVTAFFGNVQHNLPLRRDAYAYYRSALGALRFGLQADITFDLLTSICLLGLYEACACTTNGAWRQHLRALELLFQRMGPVYFQERPARSLFMWCRHHMINNALLSRKRCFLDTDEWSGILSSQDREASLTLELGELALQAPGLLEQVSNVLPGNSNHAENALTLEKLVEHTEQLREWWAKWTKNPLRLPWRSQITACAAGDRAMPPVPPPITHQQVATILRFHNLEATAGFCRYHAHVILALKAIITLMEKVPSLAAGGGLPEFASSSSGLVPNSRLETHAFAIVEALYTYALPEYVHVGATYMMMPARVAQVALPMGSPHHQWITDLMEYLGTYSGYIQPRYLSFDIQLNG